MPVRRDGRCDKRAGACAGNRRRPEPLLAEPLERPDVESRATRATLEGDAHRWIEGKDDRRFQGDPGFADRRMRAP